MHLNEEQVQRVLHNELDEPGRTTVTRHLAECPSCAVVVEAAASDEAWLLGELRRADHVAPAVPFELVARRARLRRRASRWLRRAAAVLLLLGAGTAAYAIPGSPVREWLVGTTRWLIGTTRERGARGAAPVDRSPEPAVPDAGGGGGGGGGIALVPGDRLAIRFTHTQMRGIARVTLSDEALVRVRAVAGSVPLTTSGESLTIANSALLSDYVIEIPRAAREVEILVAGRSVMTTRVGTITTASGVERDPWGRIRISLARRSAR
jgi:hypothetical protein